MSASELALLAALAALLLAWHARRRSQALARELAALAARLTALEGAPRADAAPAAPPADAAEAGPAPAPAIPTAAANPPAPRWRPWGPGFETALAARWLVWLGGLALGLGGLFLAGWAQEQGWLGPPARIGAAALLGLALLALAERARGRPGEGGRPDAVPAALAAGGLCALYGATLAAHLAYDLLGALPACLLLALVSVLGIGLGLRFGPLVALLGTLGAYAAPALVAVSAPVGWPLFLYLAALAPALTVLARLAGWAWLLWLHLIGLIAWQLGPTVPAAPAALHLLLAGGSALLVRLPWRRWHAEGAALEQPLALLTAAAAGLLLALLLGSAHAPAAVAALVALSLLTVAVTALLGRGFRLMAAVAVLGLLAAASWPPWPEAGPLTQLRDPAVGLDPWPWLDPSGRPVALALAVFAAGYGLLGLLLAQLTAAPGFWAALSAAAPPAALAAAYLRLGGLAVSPGFATLALVVAALELAAAQACAARAALRPALAAYAVGVVTSLALGMALALEAGWLSASLAVLLAATAWVGARLALDAVRQVVWPIALLLLARLALAADPAPVASGEGVLALLLGYAVPAFCFWLAARWQRRAAGDPLTALLQAAALVAWLLLATQAIALVARPLGPAGGYGLAEAGLDATAWLATAWAMLRWWRREPQARLPLVAAALLALGAALLLLGHNLLLANPIWRAEPVGAWPVLNLLLPAYGLPAALALALARELDGLRRPWPAWLAAACGQVLALAWLTLEVRRAFQGSLLTGPTSAAEWLAWSAAWLAWAGLLLVLGVLRDQLKLRAAGLVVATLALLKAFLLDLSALTGLYRAASFLALGLGLIAVGWLYRRLVATGPLRTAARP